MAKLKELIQQAKTDQIPWHAKVRLKSEVVIKKSLKNVSPENWKKIRHVDPNWVKFWGESLIDQIAESSKLIGKNDKKFVSKEVLKEFKKYVDGNSKLETDRGELKVSEINENDEIRDSWTNIASMLENGRKIYGRDGDRYVFQSEDALCFLRSIISDNFLSTVEYERGGVFKLEEWKNNNENELDVEVEKLINAWELLGESFPENIEELDLSDKNLEGELDLSRFPNLKKLDCSFNQLTSLELGKNSDLVYLDCSHNRLKGKLDLTNNSKLTGLDCSFNELEELVIGSCSDLEMLVSNDNKLRNNLKKHLLGNLNSNKIACLNISDNNLQGNLDDFKNFTNLEVLWIGSEDEDKIKKGIYNKFYGSLESLRNLTKLESLHISNTDIDGYYDFFPSNVEMYYSTEERSGSRLSKIKEKLRKRRKSSPLQLVKLKEELEVLKEKIEEAQEALVEVPSKNQNN